MLMASFVPFLVYFMLSWHDHIHRSFLQFFQGEDRAAAARSLQGIADMVRAFVVGNSVLGLLLAAAARWRFGSSPAVRPAGGAAERFPEPGAVCRPAAGGAAAAVRGADGIRHHIGLSAGGGDRDASSICWR
jgi:hypothetical protein